MWIAAAAMLASAYMNYRNTTATNKKRNTAIVAGQARQKQIQDRANARVNSTVDQLKNSNAAQEKVKAGQRYLDALQRAGVGGSITNQQQVGGSKAYRQAANEAVAGENQYIGNLSDLYSSVDAPEFQRQAEAFNIGDLGVDLGTLSGESRGQAGVDGLRIDGVRRNPWMDLAAQALAGYGQGRGMAGGAAAGG